MAAGLRPFLHRRITALALAVLMVLAAAAECEPGPHLAGPYISLGDSVAAGIGASSPSRGFVEVLADRENATDVRNLAVPGATTAQVIDAQLPVARAMIAAERPSMITISAGGNDFAGLITNPGCVEDPPPASCPLDDVLAGVAANLERLLRDLRTALHDRHGDEGDQVPIVLLAYPNFFSGTGHPWEAPAGRVLGVLGATMRDVAAGFEHVAVAGPSFDGRGDELTHVLDEPFDPHPNDAGHAVIAAAFVEALDDARR